MINEIDCSFDCVWPESYGHICTEQLAHGVLRDSLNPPFSQAVLLMLVWGTFLMYHTISR
jgi:hypothetical protein